MTTIKVLPSFFREGDIVLEPFDPIDEVPGLELFTISEGGGEVGVASLGPTRASEGTVRLFVCGNDIVGPYTGFEQVATRILLKYAFDVLSFGRVITGACDYEVELVACATANGLTVHGVREVQSPDRERPHLVYHFVITRDQWCNISNEPTRR